MVCVRGDTEECFFDLLVGSSHREPSQAVVERLQRADVADVPLRMGGHLRIRLVAFGRSETNDLHTISLSHVVERMVTFMEEFDDVLRPAQFKDPAPALLRLLTKTGFEVEKSAEPPA